MFLNQTIFNLTRATTVSLCSSILVAAHQILEEQQLDQETNKTGSERVIETNRPHRPLKGPLVVLGIFGLGKQCLTIL